MAAYFTSFLANNNNLGYLNAVFYLYKAEMRRFI